APRRNARRARCAPAGRAGMRSRPPPPRRERRRSRSPATCSCDSPCALRAPRAGIGTRPGALRRDASKRATIRQIVDARRRGIGYRSRFRRPAVPAMNTIAPAAPRRAALIFIFVTVLIDILSFGLIIPVLPHLIENFLGGDVSRAAIWYGWFATVFMA